MRSLLKLSLLLCMACNVADPSFYEALASDAGRDTGTPDAADDATPDATPDANEPDAMVEQLAVDECGDDAIHTITTLPTEIEVDTRPFRNRVNNLRGCAVDVPGPDAFIAINLEVGKYYHLHLSRIEGDIDPTLYLLDSACDPVCGALELVANYCTGTGDEHFGFEAQSSGLFYIGVDDRNDSGGGVFSLDVYNPECGDGTREHGENCDGEENCSSDCRLLLGAESLQTRAAPINAREANLFSETLTTGGFEIQGTVGGLAGCSYPEVIAVDIPDGEELVVRQTEGTCSDIGSPPVQLQLLNAGGGLSADGEMGAGGCVGVRYRPPSGGRYFLFVNDIRPDTTNLLGYELEFAIAE